MESPDYFLEIEAHFAARRGTPFILSAKDWALMSEWSEKGIPLAIVIEAIDFAFDKAEGRKTINGLSYCKHAVKDLWKERRELLVGEHASTPEADFAQQLTVLADALGAFPDIAAQVRALGSEKSVPRIEERLIELESELITHAIATLPEEEVTAIRSEITRHLGGLDARTRARTEDANLRRAVRERFGLPRLTLF
ncbi:MAG TPA: hypothetical protein VMU84_03020 [Thermoanaerobaculia bacterium]|nr:hypothetical protein [Thermoanaerobaculia bacterium]